MSAGSADRVAAEIAGSIIAAGRCVAARGWVPATSGNISQRIDLATLAMTAAGADKGDLAPDQIVAAPIYGPVAAGVSAEVALHQTIYKLHADVGAILHLHSVASTLVSRRFGGSGQVIFEGYELLKAFPGIQTHDVSIRIPIFANSQDIAAQAEHLERRASQYPRSPGFLIAGHGLYAWGATMADALRHAEAFDFLFNCQLVPGGYAL